MTCLVCNKRSYSEYCVAHKPRKPIETKAVPKPVICKHCEREGHTKAFCGQRPPREVMEKRREALKAKKRPNPKGKQYKKWLETKDNWFATNKAPYYFCHYCGKLMTRSQLTLDHKIPRSRAPELRYAKKNLVPCCFTCNSLKGSIDHDSYKHECHI